MQGKSKEESKKKINSRGYNNFLQIKHNSSCHLCALCDNCNNDDFMYFAQFEDSTNCNEKSFFLIPSPFYIKGSPPYIV